MNTGVILPGATSLLGLVFFLFLLDQYRVRRRTFQLVWAIGMLFYAIAAGAEAAAQVAGWTGPLFRAYYLAGAVWTVAWLGLGTAFLLARTRFGYAFAGSLLLAGLFTFLADRRYHYPGSGEAPLLYFVGAGVLALGVAAATYLQDDRWPRIAAVAIGGTTVLSLLLMAVVQLPAPVYAADTLTGIPDTAVLPGTIRLLTPFMNVTGAFSLLLGALFSAYVFMPKRRVLSYSLDPGQRGDELLFNLIIAPVAIAVNFVASLPGAVRALLAGRLNSRVPATIIIAFGAFVPTVTDTLNRFGDARFSQAGHLVAIVCIFAGFLVSIEVFAEIRIPFTGVVLRPTRRERADTTPASAQGAADTGATTS